ncbi:MAG: DUF1257 domain-containing protein [Kiritimatiellae bacterium]|nr:DUF1257 domain-containing protein [Kiritimatiellia bacterium]
MLEARGYGSNKLRGEYVIRLKGPYDIALNQGHTGSYGLTTDWWDGHVEREVGPEYGRLLQLYAVHKTQIDLNALGRIHVRRATHIIYDNADRKWVVTDMLDNKLFSHPSREVCLEWEQVYLEKRETLKHGGVA